MPRDADVPHVAIEIAIGKPVKVLEAARFHVLPTPGDRAEVGEVASRGERCRSSPRHRRSHVSSAPTMWASMSWTEPTPSPPAIASGSFSCSEPRCDAASTTRGLAHAWKPHNHLIVPADPSRRSLASRRRRRNVFIRRTARQIVMRSRTYRPIPSRRAFHRRRASSPPSHGSLAAQQRPPCRAVPMRMRGYSRWRPPGWVSS